MGKDEGRMLCGRMREGCCVRDGARDDVWEDEEGMCRRRGWDDVWEDEGGMICGRLRKG